MPVTAGKRESEISQREQYAKGGAGRIYWDLRDKEIFKYVIGEKILDAGCGEGITLEKLVKQFPKAEIEGIDIDPENVVICRDHNLPVREASVLDLPYEDATFDTCLFIEVIEHLHQPEKALSDLARVTKPGGRVIVVYPVDWAMRLARIICLKFKEAAFDPGHVRQWRAREVKPIMQRYGLTPIVELSLPLWPFMLHGLVVGKQEIR